MNDELYSMIETIGFMLQLYPPKTRLVGLDLKFSVDAQSFYDVKRLLESKGFCTRIDCEFADRVHLTATY